MKNLTEELMEIKIVYLRSKVYSLNKFKLSEKYLTQHNLTHLSYILNPVELFNRLKSENSILIRKHASYQWESSCGVCSKPTELVSWYFGFKKYCSKECEFSIRLESINLKIQKEKDIILF